MSDWLELHILPLCRSMHQYETQVQGNQTHRCTIALGVN